MIDQSFVSRPVELYFTASDETIHEVTATQWDAASLSLRDRMLLRALLAYVTSRLDAVELGIEEVHRG